MDVDAELLMHALRRNAAMRIDHTHVSISGLPAWCQPGSTVSFVGISDTVSTSPYALLDAIVDELGFIATMAYKRENVTGIGRQASRGTPVTPLIQFPRAYSLGCGQAIEVDLCVLIGSMVYSPF